MTPQALPGRRSRFILDSMIYADTGSATADIDDGELEVLVEQSLRSAGSRSRIMLLPPDATRSHSRAGLVTDMLFRLLGTRISAVMPALGSHDPMSDREIAVMFPGTPVRLFVPHDWRSGVQTLGMVKRERVAELSEGLVSFDWPVQASSRITSGDHDLVISIGQVVPHEVAGMANHAKNLFVGAGGKEAIDGSHFLGAMYGMERIMGRTDTPVRSLFDEAMKIAAGKIPPVLWMLTVVGRRQDGSLALRGFFSGDDRECFEKAAALARVVNMELLDEPLERVVVWLDPEEYRSTWLGNKAIYRTRMAMADGGELVIVAPGLAKFGEDAGIDALIRKYGYRSRHEMSGLTLHNADLSANRSAAAHLVHGCPEGRFRVIYAPGPGVSRGEIESVGFEWMDMNEAMERFSPEHRFSSGMTTDRDGESFFFVPNPGLGLWSLRSKFS